METWSCLLTLHVILSCHDTHWLLLAMTSYAYTDFKVMLNAESQSVQDGLLSRLFFNSSCPVPIDQVNACPNVVELSFADVPFDTQRCMSETVYVKVRVLF